MIKTDGTREQLPTKCFRYLEKGDRLRIETPGGGGWGDPTLRDPDCVQRDVSEGLISSARAEEIYVG